MLELNYTHMTSPYSSLIKFLRYNERSELLFVTFHNDQSYCYFNVGADVWMDFAYDDSVGEYYNRNIKGHYSSKKLDDTIHWLYKPSETPTGLVEEFEETTFDVEVEVTLRTVVRIHTKVGLDEAATQAYDEVEKLYDLDSIQKLEVTALRKV